MDKMRKIKFRAWDNSEKRYIYLIGFILDTQTKTYRLWFYENNKLYNTSFPIDRVLIEQYTGLKDKNRKEIYEGDIIKSIYPGYNVVIFDEEMSMFGYYYQTYFGFSFVALYRNFECFEIVGNNHENLEFI